MIIGCYHSNEVGGSHTLSALLDALSEMQKQNAELLSLTEMELGNLGKEDVNQWDEVEIESRIASMKNVVDLLQHKMEKMSKEAQEFLQCAAVLGASFDIETIEIV
eukprot:7238835-Ditylum_brightwellii.AAC.1